MTKSKTVFFVLAVNFILLTSLFAWIPDVRLTYDNNSSCTGKKSIAAIGNFVHVVWADDRDGNWEIYYKKSTDYGVTWGIDTRLTNDPAQQDLPSIVALGSEVHVVWRDERHGAYTWENYHRRSTDNGTTWETEQRLTNDPNGSGVPSIAVSGPYVHVTWMDDRDGNLEIYYKRSTDYGVNWDNDTRLTFEPDIQSDPSIAASGPKVHIVWRDNRHGTYNWENYYIRSNDTGTTWENEQRLSNDTNGSGVPSISVSGPYVHVTWMDDRDGNLEIYYKRSTDYGVTWGIDTRLTNDPAEQSYPSIEASGPKVHIVWRDERHGIYTWENYYIRSINSGTTWENEQRLTNDQNGSGIPSISISDTYVHVVWNDDRDGNLEIYYKHDETLNAIEETKEEPRFLAMEVLVMPSPFSKFAVVKGYEKVNFSIYDLTGSLTTTCRGDRIGENLKPGVYFLGYNNKMLLRIVKVKQ